LPESEGFTQSEALTEQTCFNPKAVLARPPFQGWLKAGAFQDKSSRKITL